MKSPIKMTKRRDYSLLVILMAHLIAPNTYAAVSGVFFFGDRQAMINITPKDNTGSFDNDAQSLFQAMNVSPQDSFLGPGKFIGTNAKDLNFSCANRGAQGYQCSVVLQASANVKIDSRKKTMTFQLKAVEADQMSENWILDSSKELHWESEDGKMTIDIVPGDFQIQYSQGDE